MQSLGLLALRLTIGAIFVAHGAHVLFGSLAEPGIGIGGLTESAKLYGALGIGPGLLLAVAAGLTQFVGGLLLMLGYFARWAASAIGIYIAVGIWKVHMHWGLFLNWNGVADRREGMEYSIVLLGALACLILSGAGDASIDGRRANRAEARAAGRARLRNKM